MFLNVFQCHVCVVFLLLFGLCVSQNEVTEVTTTKVPDSPSDVICQRCNCTEGLIDCSSRGIEVIFELQDWDDLKDKNPMIVDLSQNPLTAITRISSLPIQTLNFSSCRIRTLEDASFVFLAELVTLDLSRNDIATDILTRRVFVGAHNSEKVLVPFQKIRYLSLAHNNIHSLPQDVFAFMLPLTTLDLSGNPLGFIDQVTMAAITDLIDLKVLDLHSCELQSLPEGLFRRQRWLQRLDLSDNRLTTVPAVLSEAANLQYLDFGKNLVQILDSDNAINNLTKLQELRLCRNSRLYNISAGALGGLPDLVSLRICHNPRLTVLDPDFLAVTDHDVDIWPTITELYLNNNNLSRIESSFIHGWSELVAVDVTGNPYWCDCRNQWLVDVLVPELPPQQAQGMICRQPLEMRGLSFAQLHNTSKTLVCPETQSYDEMPVPDMAILLGIMIGIFATFPLVLIVVLIWRNGYFARCRSKKHTDTHNEELDAFY